MKTAIYGAGSLGTVLGAYMTKNGVDVELVNHNRSHVEALRKKQILHTEKEEYELNDGFESVAAELEGFGFIRIHRSYIVNYRFIHSINRTDVELDDGTILPIGRSKHQAVSQEFHRLVQRELSKA